MVLRQHDRSAFLERVMNKRAMVRRAARQPAPAGRGSNLALAFLGRLPFRRGGRFGLNCLGLAARRALSLDGGENRGRVCLLRLRADPEQTFRVALKHRQRSVVQLRQFVEDLQSFVPFCHATGLTDCDPAARPSSTASDTPPLAPDVVMGRTDQSSEAVSLFERVSSLS
jgi:hypothetical protein